MEAQKFIPGELVVFTHPGTTEDTDGVIKILRDDGSYDIEFVMDSGSTAEVAVRPELIRSLKDVGVVENTNLFENK